MLELRARFAQELLDVRHRLFGLRSGIANPDVDRRVEVLPHLTADKDGAAASDHGLAQVIVELLLGIGIARIELT